MDYRYYYETLQAADPARAPRRGTRVRTALIAGLVVEAVVASSQAFAAVPGFEAAKVLGRMDAPAAMIACALAAGLALAVEGPARRLLARGRHATA